MEEKESVIDQENDGEINMEPLHWYEGNISLEDAKTFIKTNITTAARSFIAIGFYLKCVRDQGLFAEDNYQDVWDFAKSEYGISKSTASRYMSMNDRFSENGNSPNIREEYKAFGKSQLQEMLYLEDEQLEQVKPGDRVEDIRNLRRPKEVPYIELPGQMEIEIDFPYALPPEQLESPVISQKQTFEMNVMDLLSEGEQECIAISQQAEKESSSIKSGCITGLSPYGSCVCCGANGVECCGQCDESCNGRCGWIEDQPKEEVLEREDNHNFIATPFGCPHKEGYSCTVPIENRSKPGDGYNCGYSCCWSCKFHGLCKLECNASAGRDGTLPEYDAVWFVKAWGVRSQGDLKSVLIVCRDNTNNAERAKAVQKELSPYGSYNHCCGGRYDFSFRSFAKGIDFRIGKVGLHFTYSRFVQELMNLYPDFKESERGEHETVIGEPENVPEQVESVPESLENVIDGGFVEILSEQETTEYAPRYFLKEQKRKLDEYLLIFAKVELGPADIKLLERQKTIVAALAAMVEELEKSEPEPETLKQEQPELPILKNNDQRAAFIDAYETWPIWIETKETGERYYRYDLSDGTSMVVKVYHAMLFDYKTASRTWEDRHYEGYGRHEYYFLHEGKFFRDCETNRSYLIEKLKEIQKKK